MMKKLSEERSKKYKLKRSKFKSTNFFFENYEKNEFCEKSKFLLI